MRWINNKVICAVWEFVPSRPENRKQFQENSQSSMKQEIYREEKQRSEKSEKYRTENNVAIYFYSTPQTEAVCHFHVPSFGCFLNQFECSILYAIRMQRTSWEWHKLRGLIRKMRTKRKLFSYMCYFPSSVSASRIFERLQ